MALQPVKLVRINSALTILEARGYPTVSFKKALDDAFTVIENSLNGLIDNINATEQAQADADTANAGVADLELTKQDKDDTLTALAGLTTAADQMIYSTGVDAFAMTAATSFSRGALANVDGAAWRTYIGAGTGAGSVTSVGILSTDLSISGSPVTTAGDITLDINTNAVTNNKFRQSGALSVVGRTSNSTGNVADITAGSDGDVLRRSGTSLAFGTVATAGIADDAVTFAKFQNITTSRLLGRTTASSGNVEEITVGSNLSFASTTLDLAATVTVTTALGVGAAPGSYAFYAEQAGTLQALIRSTGSNSSNLYISNAAGTQESAIFFMDADATKAKFYKTAANTMTLEVNSIDLITTTTTGGITIGASGQELAFFGGTPSAKAAITGSRGGNAALASLLTELAAKGLITDSSSA